MGEYRYFTAGQAEQYSFYIIPARLFTDSRFFTLSSEAKILYAIMLDRMKLSVKNNWFDKENRVYIIFKVEEVTAYINCGKNKAIELLKELETWKLIRRERSGDRRYPALTYVMNFTDYLENSAETEGAAGENGSVPKGEKPVPDRERVPESVNSERGLKIKPSSERSLKNKPSEVYYSNFNNHTEIKQNCKYNNISNPSDQVKKQIEYDAIRDRIQAGVAGYEYGSLTLLDDITQAITDVYLICSRNSSIRIAGADLPVHVVLEQYRKINMEHVLYVMDGLCRTKKKLRNPTAVIRTSLYNAVGSMGTYYSTTARIDMEGYHRRE